MAKPIQCDSDFPVVIVDCSYFVFYRLFASQKWWGFANKGNTPRLDNPEFCDAFKKHMAADVGKIMKKRGLVKGRGKQKTMAPENLIFSKDCKREDIWRMDIYPNYKGSRQVNTSFDPTAFPICMGELKNIGQSQGFFNIIYHPRLEADDVAALLFKQIRSISPTHPVVFITGDFDYLQLKDDNTFIYGLPDKNLWEAGVKKGIEDLERKIILGDTSDNIPPIITRKKQINDYMALSSENKVAYLSTLGESYIDAYNLNKTLMCWSCIPHSLVESFNAQWQITLNKL